MGRDDHMDRLLTAALRAGLKLTTAGKHRKLTGPSGKVVTLSKTPRGTMAWRQVWRDIRRVFGLELEV